MVFEQVHHARVPGCSALCWRLGIHECCLPRPRSSVRISLLRSPLDPVGFCDLLTKRFFLRRQRCQVTNRELGGGHRFSDHDSALRGTLISPSFLSLTFPMLTLHALKNNNNNNIVIARSVVPDLGRYHTAIMCYWRSHQDGGISPKKTQAKVVDHHPYFIPHVYITVRYIFFSFW